MSPESFLIIAGLLGLIPAVIASKKGHSFGMWWFFGAALFIAALPMAIMLKPAVAATGASGGNFEKANGAATNVPAWLVIVVLAVLGIFVYEQAKNSGSSPGGSFLQPVVTMSNYSQIQSGMTYQQVVQIIGTPGTESSSNHIEGVPGVMTSVDTVMYQWVNPGGSNMNAVFQNNKLVQKAQFGLQ